MTLQILAIIFIVLWVGYAIRVFRDEQEWSGKFEAIFEGVTFGFLFAVVTFALSAFALVITAAAIGFIG